MELSRCCAAGDQRAFVRQFGQTEATARRGASSADEFSVRPEKCAVSDPQPLRATVPTGCCESVRPKTAKKGV